MKKGLPIMLVLGLLIVAGCYNDKYDQLYVNPANTVCDTTSVSYGATIQPIINEYCATSSACHSSGASNGYDFSSYTGVKVVAYRQLIIDDINGTPTSGHNSMPLTGGKIPQCDIDQITAWVNQGALNN